jgi:hypothetical protein
MDTVHRTVNWTCADPRWTADRGGGGGSSELSLTATLEDGSSPAGVQQRGGHGDPGSGISAAARRWQ